MARQARVGGGGGSESWQHHTAAAPAAAWSKEPVLSIPPHGQSPPPPTGVKSWVRALEGVVLLGVVAVCVFGVVVSPRLGGGGALQSKGEE